MAGTFGTGSGGDDLGTREGRESPPEDPTDVHGDGPHGGGPQRVEPQGSGAIDGGAGAFDEDGRARADKTPARVRIQRDPTRAGALQPVRELEERTPVGEVYLRSLIRAQLALGLRLAGALVLVLGGVPLLLVSSPSVRRWRIGGLPLWALVIGVGFYPMFVFLAFSYIRRAERNEAEFVELAATPRERARR
jgi:hypothetical protein